MERESPVIVPADLRAEYSAAAAWAIENDGIHTRINLVPAAFTRNARGPFRIHLTLYSDRHPGGTSWASPNAQFDRDLRIELGDVFGPEPFEGYVEIVATSPNQDLRPQHYNELWLDYHADDGRVQVILPTIQFYGSVKRTLGGQSQIWPGLVANDLFRPGLVTINPYEDVIDFGLTAVALSGERRPSAPLALPPHSARRWLLADHIPDLQDLLAPTGLGSLLVNSSHKMICYFMIQNRATGTISGMDHLAWYYGESE